LPCLSLSPACSYLNSLTQQLFMTPAVRKLILQANLPIPQYLLEEDRVLEE